MAIGLSTATLETEGFLRNSRLQRFAQSTAKGIAVGTGPPAEPAEYELVLDGDFLEAELLESRLQPASNQDRHSDPSEYQLVLDPEFL